MANQCIYYFSFTKVKRLIVAGLEPAIPGLEVQCLIH